MDFLPLPRDPHGIFLVSDLGGDEYDGKDFHGYPDRLKEWDVQKLRHGDVPQELKTKAAQFLQTWLFFGTLCEVFGRRILRKEYTVFRHGSDSISPLKSLISTENLLSDLETWSTEVRMKSLEEQRSSQDRVVACLNEGALILRDLSDNSKETGISILSMEVHTSLASLLYILEFYSYTTHDKEVARQSVVATSSRCSLFDSYLMDLGWCPGLIERVRLRMGLPGLYYASLLGRRHRKWAHDHCSDTGCVANTIVEPYQTNHFGSECQSRPCVSICASNEHLRTILSGVSDKIPLIKVSGNANDLKLQVFPNEPSSKYIAISHVWSDGLGNPSDNSLPACDLQAVKGWLKSLVLHHDIDIDMSFWIDTLCVPLFPRSARNTAILAMRKTYEQAEAVLVLDAELLCVKVPPSPEEILVRILCSAWMTRLWTLQEAALAGRLMFQFEDRAVDFGALKSATLKEQSFGKGFFLLNRASSPLLNIFGITTSKPLHSYKYPLAAIWTSLRWRSTTKIGDMPICLATLVGSNVKSILDANEDWKMQAFWGSQDTIPSSILWCYGPWLPENGYRWAPANLLNPHTLVGQLFDDCPPAKHSPNLGLVVHGLPAFWLFNTWIPKVKTDCFSFYNSSDEKTYKVYLSSAAGNDSWERIGIHRIKKPALLLRENLTDHGWIPGVLVAEFATFEGIIRTQWLALVSVFQEGGYYDRLRTYSGSSRLQRQYTQAGYDAALDPETGQLREAWGQAVLPEQQWSIS
jgi:hypothetical protein